MHTLQLLSKAEATGTPLAAYSRAIGLNPNALSQAKANGRLSPATAAALAQELGESPSKWAMQAIAEGERSAALRRRIVSLVRGM